MLTTLSPSKDVTVPMLQESVTHNNTMKQCVNTQEYGTGYIHGNMEESDQEMETSFNSDTIAIVILLNDKQKQ